MLQIRHDHAPAHVERVFANAAGVKHHRMPVGGDGKRAIALMHVDEVNADTVTLVEEKNNRADDDHQHQKIFYERRPSKQQDDEDIISGGGDRLERWEVDARGGQLCDQRSQLVGGAEKQAQPDADDVGDGRQDEGDQPRGEPDDDDELENGRDD